MTTEQIASRYTVIKQLGEGGMGLVSLVEDSTTGQKVALKVLSSKLGATEETLLQFKQEFRLMSALKHPNCCQVYDFGVLPDGAPYLTMEVVPGHGLDEIVPLPAERFKSIFSQLLQALGYVHQLGFVHCDIKSENARVRPDEQVRLMDFGLMERTGRSGGPIRGTLHYMAPEMAKGGRIDARADLYSMGALAYEMLTGKVPFPGNNPVEIIKAHINDTPALPSLVVPEIDPAYEKIIMKLLAKEPLQRYQSAFDVLEDMGIEVAEGGGGMLLASPFVGRLAELGALGEGLKGIAASKAGKALLVTAPAGAGKSRLAEEFRFQVQLENLPYVVGSSYEQGTAPYGPWVEGLRGLIPAMRERTAELLEKHASILVKLLPELGVEPAPDLDPPSKEKMRLQATVAEVLVALARTRGVVMVMEDWHWADALSAELLAYVLRNAGDAPLMFLLNHRGAVEGEPGWKAMVQELPLSALDETESRQMVTSMLGTEEVGETFLGRVLGFAEGNPFVVEGLLEHLVRTKVLVKTKGKWNTELELGPEQMPSNLQGLLLEKLEALSEAGMAVARIGAVVGRDFRLDVLQKVSGLAEEALFDALGELSEQGVFTQNEDKTYRFAQGQLQEVLYASIEAEAKTQLHAAVAEALEASLGGISVSEATMEQVSAIANHYMASDRQEKTVVYALEAGVRSANLFANNDAHRFLTAGLEIIKALGAEGREAVQLAYLRTLGDVCRVSGRSDQAKEAFHEAIPLAETLGEKFHLGRMQTSLGKVYQMLNDYPEALKWCAASEEACAATDDKAGLARCLLTSCRINFFSGKQPEAVEQTTRALGLAREAGVKTYIGEALGFIGLIYVSSDPDKLEEGASNLNESVAILTELGDKIGLNNSLNLLGNAQNMQGDYLDAWGTFQQNQKICKEIGLKDEEIFALLNLAITAYELGNFPEAVKLAKEANAIATALASKFPLGMAMTLEAAGMAYMGEVARSRDLVAEALDLSREIKNKYLEALVLQYQVEILLYLGRLEEAKAQGEVLQALIAETSNTEPESRLQGLLGEVLARTGSPAEGLPLIEASVAASTKAHAKGQQVRAKRALAWWQKRAGQLAEAKATAEDALATAQRIGARFQAAQARQVLGEVALLEGNIEAANAHFQAMVAMAEEHGYKLLRALGQFGGAAVAPTSRPSKAAVMEAQKALRAVVADLDADAKAAFLSLDERKALSEGDLSTLIGSGAELSGAAPSGSVPDRLRWLARQLSDLAGQNLGNSDELEAAVAQKERLAQVLSFAEDLAGMDRLEKAFDLALDKAMGYFQAERGFIILESEQVKGQAMRAIRPDGGYQADWAFAEAMVARANEGAFIVADAEADERTASGVAEGKLAVQTVGVAPIRLAGSIAGHLYLDREDGSIRFDESDLDFIEGLAGQIGVALANAAQAAEWNMRSRQLEMLNELAEKINTTLVVEEVLDLVVKLTLEVTHADRGFLMLRDNSDPDHPDQLVCKAAFDLQGNQLLNERISMSICNKVLSTGQAVTVVDATADEEFQAAKSIMSLNLRTLMCVPLQAKGKNLGVLYVDSQAVVTTFTEKDLDLLKAIAGHSSGAIENATLYSSLERRASELEEALEKYRQAEHEASTDMLTGLHNRRYFTIQTNREIELSKRHHRAMSLIMLDVDHFKKFNDAYGHAIGDEVLKVMGRVLPESVRTTDIAARFGGEEFVVLCPDTDSEGAMRVAERIREAIMAVELVDLEGKPVRQITASLGVTSLLPTDERMAELMERADMALYACKMNGRNQTQIWREGIIDQEALKKKAEKEAEERAEAEAKKAAELAGQSGG